MGRNCLSECSGTAHADERGVTDIMSDMQRRKRLYFAMPADFIDRDGMVIELGARVAILDDDGMETGYGEVCRFDEDSTQPIGVVTDIDSYSYHDIRWLAPDEVRML